MKKHLRLIFAALTTISLFFSLFAAPLSNRNTVQAQSDTVKPRGWELATRITPELRAQIDSPDANLIGKMHKDGLQASPDGDWLKINSQGGMEELRNVLFSDLGNSNPLVSDRADLVISLPFEDGQILTVKTESVLSTGYGWEFSGSEGVTLTQVEDTQYLDHPNAPAKGSPQTAVMIFKASGAGMGTLTLSYKRGFGPDEEPATRLTLNLDVNNGEIDLSDPRPMTSDQVESAAGPFLNEVSPISSEALDGLPTSLDWRTQGIVPDIRDQRTCGSCWAFAAIGAMESAVAKGGGPLTDLSEQFLISCNTDNYSCSGGNVLVQKYHVDQLGKNQTAAGAVLEANMPYTATNGSCTVPVDHKYKGMQWNYVTGSWWTIPDVNQMKNALSTYGPLTVDVCVGPEFKAYRSGVFATDEFARCGSGRVNHAVVIVGWNDATESWILRNSWGTWWGDNGYMNIQWNISNLGLEASYVTYNAPEVVLAVPTASTPSGNITTTKPAFVWSRVSTATQYHLVVTDVAAGSPAIDVDVNSSGCSSSTNKCSYTAPTALTLNKNYTWKVQSKNAANQSSAFSATRSFKPFIVVPVTYTPSGSITTTKPAFVWGRVSGATSYKLAVYDISAAKYVVILTVPSSACSTTTNKCTNTPTTALVLNKDYKWKILASNASGSSAYSAFRTFKPYVPTPTTYTPSGSITTTKPAFVWARVSGATSYKLAVYDVSAAKYVVSQTVSSSSCSTSTNKCTYTSTTALSLNKSYKWKVTAVTVTNLSSTFSAFIAFKVVSK